MTNTQITSGFKDYWKKLRFNLSASDNFFFLFFYRHLYSPKKGSLSDFLSQFSLSKKGDFFVVQIGANDGITNDPIHKFIKRDRWEGVLLEPQPDVFKESLSKIYKNHPGLNPVCAAIGYQDGSQKLYKIGFSNMRWATGLASFSEEKIKKVFEDGIAQKNCAKFGIEIPTDPQKQITSEEVKVICPETLLNTYGISKIDLLQVDAEGFDLEVIRIFNIPRTKPQAIIFENENLNPEDLEECYQLLRSENYNLKEFGRDTLAVKKELSQFAHFFQ
ncbi:FkbM family methyltransferase [Algoriphagus aquimarinus]|uniref:Methyltransferase, FkbM family n=1 Tax=Algoriphagus aquimarinus TaxID=237018 RepID=A0A1I1BWT4_9BACT|nr:FkbM family methyltransferase [Algoriphagus aquimarinus]SFB54885.1 methyltransferase, FkbM family [Algoriphagus aquimarinus]|tara:strand:+ start:81007 stop:81831 length:825 start_codon:yes stop_codon:yes gene_type:complete